MQNVTNENAIKAMVKNATNEAARNLRAYTVIAFMDGFVMVYNKR